MILRSSKRLYMRITYSLVDDMQRYFTLKTINFTSMDEDKGDHYDTVMFHYKGKTIVMLKPGHVAVNMLTRKCR